MKKVTLAEEYKCHTCQRNVYTVYEDDDGSWTVCCPNCNTYTTALCATAQGALNRALEDGYIEYK